MGDDFEPNEGRLRGQGFEARLAASGYKHPDAESLFDQQTPKTTSSHLDANSLP